MYLKSLELQGFKSFPDKVVLTFDQGLTGVVGPNGSGKSNIGDAVRWVLGEQSTKTLRGSKMEDVIFSGTTERKAAAFAAVTLTIDNTGRELNYDENEVAVTRKIYRSGESEYRINGKSVRLKDINELFMDTGLGRDGYSIIGQGRIAEIVDAKSSERRDIFEEAAGISKFRYKKAEAEHKIVQAQDNINRLQDIVSELEVRVEPLRKQSEKAEKFLVLSEEKKKLEISVWIKNLKELKVSIDKISENILIYTAQYDNIELNIEKEEAAIRATFDKMRQLTLEIEKFRAEILELEHQSSDFKANIAVCENDIKHSREIINSIVERQQEKSNSELKLRTQTDECQSKIEAALSEQEAVDAELQETEKYFAAAEEEALAAEKDFSEKESKIKQLTLNQNEIKLKIASLNSVSEETSKQLETAKQQENGFTAIIEKYKSDIKNSEELLGKTESQEEEMSNRISGIDMIYKKKKTAFDEKKNDFEKIIFEIREKQHREKLLTELENNMEGFNYSVKEVMKASKISRISGIYGTVAQLIQVDDEYTVAVETALGGALQNIIVKNEDTAKRCIGLLKELRKGRATFLPVTSVRAYEFHDRAVKNEEGFVAVADEIIKCDSSYRNIMSSLLGKTVIAEDIDYATVIARKYSYRFRIVTLDGQVINAGGSFTGGSAVQSQGVLSRKNEITELKDRLSVLENLKEKLTLETEKLKNETEKYKLDRETAESEKSEICEKKLTLRSELRSLKSLLEQTEIQMKSSESIMERLENKLLKNQELSETANNSLTEINREISDLQSEIDLQQDLKKNLSEKRKEFSEKLYNLKLKKLECSKNTEALKLELKRINESQSQLSEDSRQLEVQLEAQNSIIKSKTEQTALLEQKLNDSAENIESLREKIKNTSALHDKNEQSTTEMRQKIRKINEEKEKISRELSRFDEKRNNTQRDYDEIISRMWSEYELTRSEAENTASELGDITEANSRLNELKSDIKALGNVNISAIEEYKEVSERYGFLSAQLTDVENSKRELERLITELTTDMQRIFAECFVKINENFKEIFRELFGGGKAELELTDPDDILQSGIDIKVAPPGKVIKNLISLSGGEQAFVAIAIYFAILKIKPAPFCILDEIDAALDEVNVRKYAMYLKNFTDTTQFILVTHRRGTMELANVLYGVTMQQNGISKLLKMKQADIPDEVH